MCYGHKKFVKWIANKYDTQNVLPDTVYQREGTQLFNISFLKKGKAYYVFKKLEERKFFEIREREFFGTESVLIAI